VRGDVRGGSLLGFASFQSASWLGYPDLALRAPELSAAIVTVCPALPMAVYMAVRGHGRRHNVVMTGSTLGVGVVVIGLLWSGVIRQLASRAGIACSGWSVARPAWSWSWRC
jgi:hypothetical protein